MVGLSALTDWKREYPRVPVEALCTELDDEQLRHALVVDLSANGLRIQRPLGGWSPRRVQLEFEIPEIDEVVWAQGVIRFDEAWCVPASADVALAGIVRTTGIELIAAAERHRRMLREYVVETWRARRAEAAAANDVDIEDWAMRTSGYRCG